MKNLTPNFHPGQLVVCVQDDWQPGSYRRVPVLDRVYTVKEICYGHLESHTWWQRLFCPKFWALVLQELEADQAWNAGQFAPLPEADTADLAELLSQCKTVYN